MTDQEAINDVEDMQDETDTVRQEVLDAHSAAEDAEAEMQEVLNYHETKTGRRLSGLEYLANNYGS